jgi:hypothetical protein
MEPITIQCNCGAVKAEISGDPVFQFYCHCDDCQKVHSAGYIPVMMYSADKLRLVSGDPGSWKLKATPRRSCRECGTRLWAEPPGFGVVGVIATLLPAGMFKPTFHSMYKFAAVPVKDDLPKYKDWPKAWGGSDELVAE